MSGARRRPRPWPAIALGAVAAVVAGGAPVGADVLCAKRSGKVVVRDACRPRERALDAEALGLAGPPGAAGPVGAPGPDAPPGGHPYRLLDGMGRPVGTLVAFDTLRGRTVVPLPDGPVQLVVINGESYTTEIAPVALYEEPDCAGTPFIRYGGGLVPAVQVFGSVGYYARANSTERMFASQEYRPGTGCGMGHAATGHGTCCQNVAVPAYASPAEVVPLSSLGVTAPFGVTP